MAIFSLNYCLAQDLTNLLSMALTHLVPVSYCFTMKSHVYVLQQFTDLSFITPAARELCISNFYMNPITIKGAQNVVLTNVNIKM